MASSVRSPLLLPYINSQLHRLSTLGRVGALMAWMVALECTMAIVINNQEWIIVWWVIIWIEAIIKGWIRWASTLDLINTNATINDTTTAPRWMGPTKISIEVKARVWLWEADLVTIALRQSLALIWARPLILSGDALQALKASRLTHFLKEFFWQRMMKGS